MPSFWKTIEYRIADEQTRAWGGAIASAGLSHEQMRGDLTLHAVRAARKWNGCGDVGGFVRWCVIRRIRQLLREKLIRSKGMAGYRLPTPLRAEDDPAPAIELRETITVAMASLSPRRRMIVTLWLGGRDLEDICQRMGVSRQRIFQQLHRSFVLMRPHFE